MEIKFCFIGLFVLAAAAVMGVEFRLDLFENILCVILFWIVIWMLVFVNLFIAVIGLNVDVKIKVIVVGIFLILKKIIVRVFKI